MKELEATAAGGGGEKPNSGLCLDATELCDAGQAGQPGGDGARYCGHHRPGLIRTPGLPLLHRPPTLHPWGAGSLNEAGKAGAA